MDPGVWPGVWRQMSFSPPNSNISSEESSFTSTVVGGKVVWYQLAAVKIGSPFSMGEASSLWM
jgi:hypothetical protein